MELIHPDVTITLSMADVIEADSADVAMVLEARLPSDPPDVDYELIMVVVDGLYTDDSLSYGLVQKPRSNWLGAALQGHPPRVLLPLERRDFLIIRPFAC